MQILCVLAIQFASKQKGTISNSVKIGLILGVRHPNVELSTNACARQINAIDILRIFEFRIGVAIMAVVELCVDDVFVRMTMVIVVNIVQFDWHDLVDVSMSWYDIDQVVVH